MLPMLKRNIVVLLVAGLVLGLGAYAWAADGPSGPRVGAAAATADSTGTAHPARHRALRLVRHAYHGDVDVWVDGATRSVTFDRGALVAADEDSVTIKYPTGATADFAITSDTKIRGAGENHALVTGKPTLVLSEGGTTKAVLQRLERDSASADGPQA